MSSFNFKRCGNPLAHPIAVLNVFGKCVFFGNETKTGKLFISVSTLMKRITLLLAICIMFVSCGHISRIDIARIKPDFAREEGKCDENIGGGLSQREKEMIYSDLFSWVYNIARKPVGSETPLQGDVVYRVTTKTDIQPVALERNKLMNADVLASFRFENKKPERLPVEQMSIWLVFPYDKDSDVKQLFYSAKRSRKRPTEGAVVFSNIGFDPEKREGLVYVEYFDDKVGFRRFWLQLFLTKGPGQVETDYRFSGIELLEPLPLDDVDNN